MSVSSSKQKYIFNNKENISSNTFKQNVIKDEISEEDISPSKSRSQKKRKSFKTKAPIKSLFKDANGISPMIGGVSSGVTRGIMTNTPTSSLGLSKKIITLNQGDGPSPLLLETNTIVDHSPGSANQDSFHRWHMMMAPIDINRGSSPAITPIPMVSNMAKRTVDACVMIQKHLRGFVCRRKYQRLRRAAIQLQSAIRTKLDKVSSSDRRAGQTQQSSDDLRHQNERLRRRIETNDEEIQRLKRDSTEQIQSLSRMIGDLKDQMNVLPKQIVYQQLSTFSNISYQINARTLSYTQNDISDLRMAMELNGNTVAAGMYLVDVLMSEHTSVYVTGSIPSPSFVVANCFLEDTVMGSQEKAQILYYFIDHVSSITNKEAKSNDVLIYWLSNVSLILKGLESALNDQASGNSGMVAMESLKIKTNIQTLILKIYKGLLDNVLGAVQPLCMKAVNNLSMNGLAIYPLLRYLTNLMTTMKQCHIYIAIQVSLFEQVFQHISAVIFNEMVLRKELCSMYAGAALKLYVSELEFWIHSNGGRDSLQMAGHLSKLRQAVNILLIEKRRLANEDTRREVCPSISFAQIKQLLTMYCPDPKHEEPIPMDLIAYMSSKEFNRSENILLDTVPFLQIPLHNLHNLTMRDLKMIQYGTDQLVSKIIVKSIELYNRSGSHVNSISNNNHYKIQQRLGSKQSSRAFSNNNKSKIQ
ncbi:hypothetical protein SAMD00019534_070650 [Acytostelium subglobosum LB1]|uniref:hypothetical protein n=1 Tax=Acytostelium subglobosum LB1 TaxID=1410327 RepID=UPI000644B8EE|nr:hypothetical protein SAMD00019534_070650 [Acytostelium subglobosum LB1]GAM23890.1 hypothetical protein SAMD00019534_070650 [Acytostelium subglobosum LB1]|eukprot:XP_012752926.1 hypothetical protein SAMD00019534_070650 [Acytostelium subglobosum LB1]